MAKVNVGIIGGAGYTGGELIRLLIHHSQVKIAFIHSKSSAGKPITHVHSDLIGETKLRFTDELHNDIDVLFLCVGHGEAKKFLAENEISKSVKVIDLSQDFRLARKAKLALSANGASESPLVAEQDTDREFVYGLPELNRDKIKSAQNIANPGCFATGIQLGLLPLAKAGLLDSNVYTTGITGSTGAGQSLSGTSHFSWRANNVQAYKTLSHQHLNEIHESIHQLQASFPVAPGGNGKIGLNFIPWRGDFTRGIFISSQIDCDLRQQELTDLYEDYYQDHPFTWVSQEPIFLKQVVNTNKCVIQLEKVGTKLVIHSAIDNLLKGASGQAVQNMNLVSGLDESAGLNLKANFF